MDNNLAKLLEEEARRIQERTIINPEPEEERETEDIECEVVGEEIYEVYNEDGKLIKVDLDIRDTEYVLCKDGSYVHGIKYIEIYGTRYNPFINTIGEDDYNHSYIYDNPNTWVKLIRFESDGSYDVDNWEIISKNNLYELTLDALIIDSETYYFLREDRIKYGYIIQNGILVTLGTIEDFKKDLFSQYPYFEQVTKSIYKDNWDINQHQTFNKKCLIIKFDKFNITNSSRQSHEIVDLYVLIPFNIEKGKIQIASQLFGGRGLISTLEKAAEYKHSHLSSSWNCISSFCLGSGPIHNYILDFNRNPNENTLFSILYNIKIYVEWESIEGRPYKYIKNIGKKEISSTESINVNIPYLIRDYFKDSQLPIKIYNRNNINDILIEEEIVEVEILKYVSSDCKVFKDKTTGKYYKGGTINNSEQVSTQVLLNFKGEDIKTKVYNSTEIKIEDIEYVAHPSITKAFILDAYRRIRKYYFKKTTGIDTRKSQNFYI